MKTQSMCLRRLLYPDIYGIRGENKIIAGKRVKQSEICLLGICDDYNSEFLNNRQPRRLLKVPGNVGFQRFDFTAEFQR